MALTSLRQAGLAVAACGLIWYAIEPHRARSGSAALDRVQFAVFSTIRPVFAVQRSIQEPTPATVAAKRLSEANGRWRLLELRDSIAALAAKSTSASPSIIIDASIPDEVRQRLQAAILLQWQSLVPQPSLPVVIAVVFDTSSSPHGHARPFHFTGAIPIEGFLPSADTKGACLSIAHLATSPRAGVSNLVIRNLVTPETIASLLNPCALLAAFGMPGPQVSEWLRGSGWKVARLAEWSTTPSPWTEPVLQWWQGSAPRGGWLDGLGDPTWHIRGYVAPKGIACLAGEAGACSRIVLDRSGATPDSVWRSSVVSSRGSDVMSFYFPRELPALGPADGWVVSEMVRTLGPDRFARFWHSSLPVDSAFHEASGQRLDDWVREWGRRMYGQPGTGPAVSASGILAGVVFFALTLWISIAVERRRRVT